MSVVNLTNLPYKRGAFGLLKPKMGLGIPKETLSNPDVSVGIEPYFGFWTFIL